MGSSEIRQPYTTACLSPPLFLATHSIFWKKNKASQNSLQTPMLSYLYVRSEIPRQSIFQSPAQIPQTPRNLPGSQGQKEFLPSTKISTEALL